MPFDPANTERRETGVRWSGIADWGLPSWTPSAGAQATAQAAYLKAVEQEEARIAAYAKSKGLVMPKKRDAA